jgi:hypothetical protein
MEAAEQNIAAARTHRGSERELVKLVLIVVFIGGRWSWTFLERDPRNLEELPQKVEKEWQRGTRKRGKAGRFCLDRPKWLPK